MAEKKGAETLTAEKFDQLKLEIFDLFIEARTEAYQEGLVVGKKEGYSDGDQEGYKRGLDDGYQQGKYLSQR